MKRIDNMKGRQCMNNMVSNTSEVSNKRKYFVDNIRWVTVILVLIYHVLLMYNGVGINVGCGKITNLSVQHYDMYMYFVYPWFMPVLFLVAGMSSRYYLDSHTNKEFIRSRTTKLLVPSTIGLFFFQFIQGYVSMALGDAFDNMKEVPGVIKYFIMVLSGQGVLWFAMLLWVYSLLLVLVRKIEKGKLLETGSKTPIWMMILFYIPVWASGLIMNTPVITVYRISFYFVFFMLGYYVFSNDEVIERVKKVAILAVIIGVVISIAFSIYYFAVKDMANFADKPVNRTFLYAASAYFGSLAMVAGFAKFFDFSNGLTKWMSKKSFGLYVFHYLGISTVALVFGKTGMLPAALVYMLSLVAGFVFGFGLYEIISRIPFYRWAVLGVKKCK
ncbi:MAG: acyltransferase [Eubacterium sp.]|nr:acyltransferase [Eubacterium sp.]